MRLPIHAPVHRNDMPVVPLVGPHVHLRLQQQPHTLVLVQKRCIFKHHLSSHAAYHAGVVEPPPTEVQQQQPSQVALYHHFQKLFFAAITFAIRIWRWTDSLWLHVARLGKGLTTRPHHTPHVTTHAVSVPPPPPPPLRAPTSPACGIADPAVLHMLQKLHDPTTTHDDRVEHVQRAVGTENTRTLFSATSRHSLQVEKMRVERGVPEPSGAQLWSVEGTKHVLEEEGALRDALFARIYEQLGNEECRRRSS